MSFVIAHDEETATYFTTGNFPSVGGWLDSKATGLRSPVIYYDRLDFVLWDWTVSTSLPAESWCRFDPLYLDNSGTLFTAVNEPGTISGYVCNELALGYWDRIANEQKVYAWAGGSPSKPFHEVSPLAINNVLQLDAYPKVGTLSSVNGLSGGEAYYYSFAAGNWLFFEEYGKAYQCQAFVYDETLTQMQKVMAEVDLVTGNATIVPIPVFYGTSPSNPYTESLLRGQTCNFTQMQFVQDDDSTASRPKGQMYFWSEATTNPDDSGKLRGWLKICDWNPTDYDGIPVRVHCRERLLTAVNLTKSTPGSVGGVHESSSPTTYNWVYHPRSNQLFTASGTVSGAQLDPNEQKLIYASPNPVFDRITEPFALSKIASGKTVAWGVLALGDLEEPVTGQDVEWTLENESTVGEVLATTPTPGETVTLANTVNPTDAAVSPITVYEDGVALTETTHYTLNRGSSQITFVAPKPLAGGEVYTADYRHWDDPQSSPHGTLQSTTSSSDSDGLALTRIRYAEEDPALDRWDRLTAEDV